MSKFPLIFIVIHIALSSDVCEAMIGGQNLEQPLPFTVYILTGNPDDVFSPSLRRKRAVLGKNAETNPTPLGSLAGLKNSTAPPQEQSISTSQRIVADQGEKYAPLNRNAHGIISESEKASSEREAEAGHGMKNEAEGRNLRRTVFVERPEQKTGTNAAPDEKAPVAAADQSSPSSKASEDDHVNKTVPEVEEASLGEEPLSPPTSDDDTEAEEDITLNQPGQCSLATEEPPEIKVKPPRPTKLWRYCMGVIVDNQTIVTGGLCGVATEGEHFLASVNATDHDHSQEITRVADGRHSLDLRAIRMATNENLSAEIPKWQKEDKIYWKLGELSNVNTTGFVPSFGYPPKVAAMKLLNWKKCSEMYDKLLEKYPVQTVTLPGHLPETVACATKADEAVDFPGIGMVQPGLACPDSLGAPFVLEDSTLLGVLVASDCIDMNVAFFQTLGRGLPEFEEDD